MWPVLQPNDAVQVYLGKWQETDVAVKVLIEMQHLAPNNEVQPQDPATLEPWKGSEEDNHPQQGGEKSKTAGGLPGITDPNASLTGESTLDVGSGNALTPEAQTAIKTLEREVHCMLCKYCYYCECDKLSDSCNRARH